MKPNRKNHRGILIVAVLATLLAGVCWAQETQVTGMITEEGLLETTDGRTMEVADTEMGAELLEHVGQKVQVSGEITEEEGTIIIQVNDFKVMEE